jgi:hypothetical protein
LEACRAGQGAAAVPAWLVESDTKFRSHVRPLLAVGSLISGDRFDLLSFTDEVAVEILVLLLIIGIVCGAICAAIASNKGRNAVGWFFGGFFLGFLSLLLGIVMIVIVACLPNLIEQRRRDRHVDNENRRLREQLMQEQMKSEAFRRHAAARLDSHDNQLGVDTRSVVSALPAPDGMFGTPQLEDLSGGQPAFPQQAHQQEAYPQQGYPQQGYPQQGYPQQARPAQDFFAPQTPAPQQASGRVEVVHPRDAQAAQATTPRVGPTREWHYEYQGSTRGPVNDRQLVELAREGQIIGTTLIWTEQLGDWKPAQQVKALQPYLRS